MSAETESRQVNIGWDKSWCSEIVKLLHLKGGRWSVYDNHSKNLIEERQTKGTDSNCNSIQRCTMLNTVSSFGLTHLNQTYIYF